MYDLSYMEFTICGVAPVASKCIKLVAEKFQRSKFINAGDRRLGRFLSTFTPKMLRKKADPAAGRTPVVKLSWPREKSRDVTGMKAGNFNLKDLHPSKGTGTIPRR